MSPAPQSPAATISASATGELQACGSGGGGVYPYRAAACRCGGWPGAEAPGKHCRPNVSFVGRVDNAALPALYAGCKAFLFPGEEDFGITPLEAMAAGRPVIAYGRGGGLDSVADGETGIFFERQTADALTEALDAYEASTEQTWVHDKLKRQAESFSEEIFRKKMIAFIADVLENKV